MGRKHFLESLERDIDFKQEYRKLENLCALEFYDDERYKVSINKAIDEEFWDWDKRSNYTSFDEVRRHLGFDLNNPPVKVDIVRYFLFCEMILNLINDLRIETYSSLEDVVLALINTIKATITKAGFETRVIDGEIRIVEANCVAIEVADMMPEISAEIIRYNHFLLKGDLDSKKTNIEENS